MTTEIETRLAALEASVAALLQRAAANDEDRAEALAGMASFRKTADAVDEACRAAGLDRPPR